MRRVVHIDVDDILDIVGDKVPPHTRRAKAAGCAVIEHEEYLDDQDAPELVEDYCVG